MAALGICNKEFRNSEVTGYLTLHSQFRDISPDYSRTQQAVVSGGKHYDVKLLYNEKTAKINEALLKTNFEELCIKYNTNKPDDVDQIILKMYDKCVEISNGINEEKVYDWYKLACSDILSKSLNYRRNFREGYEASSSGACKDDNAISNLQRNIVKAVEKQESEEKESTVKSGAIPK